MTSSVTRQEIDISGHLYKDNSHPHNQIYAGKKGLRASFGGDVPLIEIGETWELSEAAGEMDCRGAERGRQEELQSGDKQPESCRGNKRLAWPAGPTFLPVPSSLG
ncbi:hypothetical protein AAFF_G00295640 [Aldrovandia affinis]|uniref:Uncharacterized protein n=1 Tax=Aldrovandia affinis TaxID=143900 RepID=A0AAD7WRS4_9TELE|nr:hypothetical protein AAFF_G00295640 [Aldrovandia affinis]